MTSLDDFAFQFSKCILYFDFFSLFFSTAKWQWMCIISSFLAFMIFPFRFQGHRLLECVLLFHDFRFIFLINLTTMPPIDVDRLPSQNTIMFCRTQKKKKLFGSHPKVNRLQLRKKVHCRKILVISKIWLCLSHIYHTTSSSVLVPSHSKSFLIFNFFYSFLCMHWEMFFLMFFNLLFLSYFRLYSM